MHMTFDVGNEERHRVDFDFDQTWGGLKISVDGNPVVSQRLMYSLSLVRTWKFDVGTEEVHHVRIEKRRALFLAFARPQPVTAYVDDKLVAHQDM